LDRWVLEQRLGDESEQGEVWRAHASGYKDLKFAIKISKPKTSANEYRMLAKLTHPNIIRVFDRGDHEKNRTFYPYYVMEYLGERVWPLDDAIEAAPSSNRMAFCLHAFFGTASALRHVHRLKKAHGDVKPSNILVGGGDERNPVIKLIDFGFVRGVGTASLAGRAPKKASSLHRPYNCRSARHADIWQLATCIKRLLGGLEKSAGIEDRGSCPWPIDISDYADFKILLTEWSSEEDDSPPEAGLTRDFYTAVLRFWSRYEINQLPSKLRGGIRYLRIPELAMAAHLEPAFEAIRLPPRQLVLYTERIKELITRPQFGALRYTRQLGFTHLVYPGALGTRFEHCLGVYYLACRFFIRMSAEPSFRSVCKEPREGLKFILAALLHDIGHFPFAHQIEEFSPRDFPSAELRKLGSFIADERIHRRHGYELFVRLRPALKKLFDLSNSEINDIRMLAFTKRGGAEAEERGLRFLHGLLDGPIDLDKLDYVERDAHHCGVPYGNYLDVDRILETMRIDQCDNDATLAFDWRGVGCLEQLATARHQMYANVYWHRAVRAATTMFKHAFFLYARLARTARAVEELFFESHSDDAALSGMHSLHGVPTSKRSSRDGRAIQRMIDAVSGHRRTLFKQVFESDHDSAGLNKWGRTYLEQREKAAQLFNYLKNQGFWNSTQRELGDHNVLIDCHDDTPPSFDEICIIDQAEKRVTLGKQSRIVVSLRDNFRKQACRIRVFVNADALRDQQRENRATIKRAIERFS
jgi:HD superfamily phosphohydrolase